MHKIDMKNVHEALQDLDIMDNCFLPQDRKLIREVLVESFNYVYMIATLTVWVLDPTRFSTEVNRNPVLGGFNES